jgi:hypothetical protein
LIFLTSAVASCVDTNLNESEKAFESEFNKLYGDKEDEKKAAQALADAEKQAGKAILIGINKIMLMFKTTCFGSGETKTLFKSSNNVLMLFE